MVICLYLLSSDKRRTEDSTENHRYLAKDILGNLISVCTVDPPPKKSIVFKREEGSLRRQNLFCGMRLIATMGYPPPPLKFQNALLTKIFPASGVRHIRNELKLMT